MKYFCFRFDVDTPKCIKSGVPNLISLSKELDVPFTFFINMGRGTSRWSFIKKKISFNGNATPHRTLKLSNLKKLGLWNYFFMAFMNPQVGNTHPDIIQALKKADHEVGLHGGSNHGEWQNESHTWGRKKILEEIMPALDSVEKVQQLKNEGKINLITPAEVVALKGENRLEKVTVKDTSTSEETDVEVDNFIPLFGLSPKLGPISNWGLEIEKNAIKVDNTYDYQTNIPGIYAIGDVNTYPGKLKLILCGFHEATLMCQSAYQKIYPDKKYVMKYTTVGGVTGFDGSKKEAPKAVVKAID